MKITIVSLLALFIFLGPVFTIMAVNTLFTATIPLTFWTWLSMAWLHLIFASSNSR
jgi:hypothetical protein